MQPVSLFPRWKQSSVDADALFTLTNVGIYSKKADNCLLFIIYTNPQINA